MTLLKPAFAAGLLAAGFAGTAQAQPARVHHHGHSHKASAVAVRHRTLIVTGTKRADKIVLRAHNGRSVEVDVGRARVDVLNTQFNHISVNAGAGNDAVAIDESRRTIRPSAVVNGGAGDDTLSFDGSSANEQLALSADGHNARLTRDVGNVSVGLSGIEAVGVASLGGNDTLAVGDLTGTSVKNVTHDEAATVGGTTAGTGTDQTIVNGTNNADSIAVTGTAGTATVTGLASTVAVTHANPATDGLTVDGQGGDDNLDGSQLATGVVNLELDGGDGNDTITGSAGNDVVNGGTGNDTALMGAGDDQFVWNPGDGNDTVEGQDGNDTLQFNGSDASENVHVQANGTRVQLTRDVGAVTMDLNGLEQIGVASLGGNDTLTVDDLTGTDVNTVTHDLASTLGGTTPAGGTDETIVNGTPTPDTIVVSGSNGVGHVNGLAATVDVVHANPSLDDLTVDGLEGDDTITAAPATTSAPHITIDGGDGNDTLTGDKGGDAINGGAGVDTMNGGPGADVINGGTGNDTALMGAGDDQFVWNPGDGSDTVEGQDGSDMLQFNGSNANENFDVSANGTRARVFRDVGNVTMDLNGLEHVNVASAGGNDTLTVDDLTGTGVQSVTHDLAATVGGTTPSTGTDQTIVNGTNNADTMAVAGNAGVAQVTGLAAEVDVTHANPAIDQLMINALAGDDTVSAASLAAGIDGLAINGGAGNDTITGSAGNDVIIGAQGTDTALMGPGDDQFVWNPGDGSDTVDGQAGNDKLTFNGSNAAEQISVSANGSRVRLFRDVANITMDLSGIEETDVALLGGADTLTVDDLTGTGMTKVAADLSAFGGVDDGSADNVIVNGTAGNDTIHADSPGAGVANVTGLAAQVDITHANPAQDQLTINGLAGDDSINGAGLTVGSIGFRVDGGDGNDLIRGGDGNDTLLGGNGDDTIFGGPGVDTIDGGSGTNTITQD